MAKGQKRSNKETRKPKQEKSASTGGENAQPFENLRRAQAAAKTPTKN